ncbi:MAG: hypothetical protein COT74_07060 [Bdellovibrionales bacterium CG10_big_fil_rev_8_21_14_0_10_45_34]|nr:MAG: hypothetical protein COT74_07060 [Bdellovibrionales bacterium CG10_big_fil_rev_8_21_14_0_10_45_34]
MDQKSINLDVSADYCLSFLSDIHIRSVDDDNYKKLISYLRFCLGSGSKPEKTQRDETAAPNRTALGFSTDIELRDASVPTHLFFLGDIFDVWVGPSQYWRHKYSEFFTLLKELSLKGIKIFYFEGNHDFQLDNEFLGQSGAQVFKDSHFFAAGELNFYVSHGDLMNPSDEGYIRLRKLLRSQPVKWLIKNVPGSVIESIGKTWSNQSRRSSQLKIEARTESVREMMRHFAESFSRRHRIDWIITGHTHVRELYRTKNSETVFVNLGTWLDAPNVFEITNSTAGFKSVNHQVPF